MTFLGRFLLGDEPHLLWKNDVVGQLFDATNVLATLADIKCIVTDENQALTGLANINTLFNGAIGLIDGDRVLVTYFTPDQGPLLVGPELAEQIAAGIYVAHSGAWTRATDANTWAKIQDAIVECPRDYNNPLGSYVRYALWNPSGVAHVLDTDPQFWIMINNDTDSRSTIPVVRLVSSAPITRIGAQTVDGFLTADGDLIVLKDQVNPVDNGYYVARAGTWDRFADPNFPQATLEAEPCIPSQGDINAGLKFKLVNTSSSLIVPGVDPQIFVRLDTNNSVNYGPIRVPVRFNDMVMCRSFYDQSNESYNAVIVQLPPITPGSAGKKIFVRGYSDKKNYQFSGTIVGQPNGGNSLLGFAPGACASYQESPIMEFMSDGIDTWIPAGLAIPQSIQFRVS